MLHLALDIVTWLGAAALLGFGVAWLLRGVDIAELRSQVQRLETDLGLREHELGETRRNPVGTNVLRLGPAASPVALPGELPRKQLAAPVSPEFDDLKRIRGVGPVLEKRLHALGVHHFRQVALWTEAEIDVFDRQLGNFHGRIRRENWVHSATEEHFKKTGEWLGSGAATAPTRETARH